MCFKVHILHTRSCLHIEFLVNVYHGIDLTTVMRVATCMQHESLEGCTKCFGTQQARRPSWRLRERLLA